MKILEEQKKQGQLAVVMGRGGQAMQDVETFLWEEHSRCAYVRVCIFVLLISPLPWMLSSISWHTGCGGVFFMVLGLILNL